MSRFLIPDDEEVPQPILNHTPEQINRGRQLFHSQRCDACHSLGEDEGATSAENRQIRLRIPIDGDQGCLSKVPTHGVPWFSFTEQQRALMRETVKLSELSDAWDTETRLRNELQRWRCLDCHRRDGLGGPDFETLAHFESSEADLGDEGSVPPDLSGVGRKMNQAALIEVIASGEKSRPYMLTRMPAYGRETATKLARLLAASDIPEDEVPTVRETAENQVGRNMWGRALVGSEGLGCITCHALNGHPALGTSAIDLALSPKRLRPEWFRDYLIDPARFRPGTRMPSFWPKGVPSLKGHGGSTSRQIDSLWAYLAEIDQSRLPVGLLDRKELVLQPGERPLVFRTFMEGVGTHAIAVGFRSGPHAAFDALGMRWAYFWQGSFLDAESTWDNRFTPPAEPRGEPIIVIQKSVPQWDSSVRFMGYALNPVTGVPRFRYEVGSTVLEDWIEPVAEGQKGMVRTIVRKESGEPVWIEIASGKSIQATAQGWLVGDRLKVSSAGLLRASGEANRQGLQVLLPAVATASGIEVQYGW